MTFKILKETQAYKFPMVVAWGYLKKLANDTQVVNADYCDKKTIKISILFTIFLHRLIIQ